MNAFTLNIDHFKAGDRSTFKFVFDNLYQSLCLFTNRFLNDLTASEDIVQESFLTLWYHREEMESPVHIKSFLYVTNRNSALDYLKHQKIKNQYNQQVLERNFSEEFEQFIIAEEVEYVLLKTQEQLPGKCKQIFILAMQGKNNEEIAAELKISVNTVKTQKKIAYKKLKSLISEISCILLLLRQY